MSARDPKNEMKDYSEFLNADILHIPAELEQKVLGRVQKLLHPSAWSVFAKLLGIHSVVGFLSLSVCHQFGMNPFGTESSISDWFMEMGGHSVCMIVCGITFVSFSIFSAGYFLTIEEVRTLKRTEFLQILSLGVLSIALFSVFGSGLALTVGGLWLLGALIGGCLATEATWKMKMRTA